MGVRVGVRVEVMNQVWPLIPFMPPEKPLQLANTMRGRPSRFRSLMAWAVLKAESGNHTWPACWMTCRADQ